MSSFLRMICFNFVQFSPLLSALLSLRQLCSLFSHHFKGITVGCLEHFPVCLTIKSLHLSSNGCQLAQLRARPHSRASRKQGSEAQSGLKVWYKALYYLPILLQDMDIPRIPLYLGDVSRSNNVYIRVSRLLQELNSRVQ